MTAKPPPVPPENQSPKGTGDPKTPSTDDAAHGHTAEVAGRNVDQQGRQGNSKINTTNQGYQQDR
ncbi:hypothetical protein GJ689_21310 [Rhodoplanes serenus]|jgi:hypothetical protein|uniref:Uncharacterized protein n=1 Tax=Rhodoplanes serenus TaxID=200615 RepID=A0A327K043_9BRAD|nr:hypothetical protein [Rhodoplanes serenus]MBI5112403.1 hypothetical protein [Rhodovulum sp.]MTW18744.1 hypothetical protein [Rhodoplanes serenus]RAI28728.1 hypothetical protein CH340_23405 [Rhodoplanes serenus]VCU09259.1 hypothetical protein RHODGE_RHODGE_02433 [Rhodoplanes serenus]